ncbi:hypothetical protein [Komagataeibacter sp. FNDCF1]|nr:hypothetical protein [Komagataeibacter sp. FNDCF1]
MPRGPDMVPGRLANSEIARNLTDACPPFTHARAVHAPVSA